MVVWNFVRVNGVCAVRISYLEQETTMLTKPIFSGLIAAGLGLVGLGLTATQPQALPHASLGQTWQDGTYAQTVQYRRDYGRRYGHGHG